MNSPMVRKLAAEYIGSLFLLAAVVGSGIMAEKLSGGNVAVALLANAVATGAALFVLITSFAPISGAHFNPAVTLVMALRREISSLSAALYILIQVLGAISGVLLAHAMFDLQLMQLSSTARSSTGMMISEVVASFGLVFFILAMRDGGRHAVAAGVALYVVAGYWFTASTCFANPAVTIARAFSDTFAGIALRDVPTFILCQALGAVFAHLLGSLLLRAEPGHVVDR